VEINFAERRAAARRQAMDQSAAWAWARPMVALASHVDDKVVETITSLFHERMNPFGLSDVVVRPGEDHDGDPVIFVDAVYALRPRPIEPQAIFDLESSRRDAVRALGERRFVHVIYKFNDAQKVARYR
jgi:hypothetical protein